MTKFKSGNWEAVRDGSQKFYVTQTIECKDIPLTPQSEPIYCTRVVVVAIKDEVGTLSIGIARCSHLDSFNYALGREIAAGRALKLQKKLNMHTPFEEADFLCEEIFSDKDQCSYHVIVKNREDIALLQATSMWRHLQDGNEKKSDSSGS
jgi:hypothetical protein